MSRSLRTIQVVMKVIKVLCQIAFVCSIIGAIFCVLGGVSVKALVGSGYEINGMYVEDYIIYQTGLSVEECAAVLFCSAVPCVGLIVETRLIINYLKLELDEGTPFTFTGADALKKASIALLIVDFSFGIVAAILFAILVPGDATYRLSFSLVTPLLMLLASVVFRYGAEQNQINKTPNF